MVHGPKSVSEGNPKAPLRMPKPVVLNATADCDDGAGPGVPG